MYIDGIGISCYRSFGPQLQLIGPFSKINVFIGKNNTGKSNILSFLKDQYRNFLKIARTGMVNLKYGTHDRPDGQRGDKLSFAVAMRRDGEKRGKLFHDLSARGVNRNDLMHVLNAHALTFETEATWFVFEGDEENDFELSGEVVTKLIEENVISGDGWRFLGRELGNVIGGNHQQLVMKVLLALAPTESLTVEINMVPAIRRVQEGTTDDSDLGGTGIISRLAQLQNPTAGRQQDKARFEAINTFLQTVTGNKGARIEIPHDRQTITVEMDGKSLPLESVGTGIHEVVILAAAATTISGQVLCIEEPELHLHPRLQKELLRYLDKHTDNQYFITTHSAHLMDLDGASVFHVRYENGHTAVEAAYTDHARFEVCAELGYRASDLLQSNCVIWVEGPSDRVYLNHWIRAVDADLVEGLHYSIMFYGGRLLSHLTPNDPEVTDFISLRRLNRNLVIVMDSDREKKRGKITATKGRIKRELDVAPGFAWVTSGREIENYIEPTLLEKAVKAVHGEDCRLSKTGQYDKALTCKRGKPRKLFPVDKVKVALEVTKADANLEILDLREKVDKLVKFIHEANN